MTAINANGDGAVIEPPTVAIVRPSEDCPNAPADDPMHCGHWYDCEPCCRCGDDTIDPCCDCPRCTDAREAS